MITELFSILRPMIASEFQYLFDRMFSPSDPSPAPFVTLTLDSDGLNEINPGSMAETNPIVADQIRLVSEPFRRAGFPTIVIFCPDSYQGTGPDQVAETDLETTTPNLAL